LIVTAAPTKGGLRFTAVGNADKVRLEVYDTAGNLVLDTGFHSGSLLDWSAVDAHGRVLADATYTCVITAHDLAGGLRVKQGNVTVRSGLAELELPDAGTLSPRSAQQDEEVLTTLAPDDAPALTLTAHDGNEGRVVSTRGALSFRVGNLFAGRDKELLRLDPEGTIKVKGALEVGKGIRFADGTVQTSSGIGRLDAAGNFVPAASGSGTQNRLAKWLDNGGTLGDSAFFETDGNVGLGTTSPESLFHIAGPSGVSAITLNTPGNQRFRLQTVPAVQNWGALTLNANYNAGWLLDDETTNGWFFKLDTRGGNASSASNGLWLYRVPPGVNPHTDEVPVFGVSSAHAFFANNVGIGVSEPSAALHVVGADAPPNGGIVGADAAPGLTVVAGSGSDGTQTGGRGGEIMLRAGDGGSGCTNFFNPSCISRGAAITIQPGLNKTVPGTPGLLYLAPQSGNVRIGGSNNGGSLVEIIGASASLSMSGRSTWTFFTNPSGILANRDDLIITESPNGTGLQTRLQFAAGGNVGIGDGTPKARFQVQQGDIYVATEGRGVILKSPDGTICRKLSIDNTGNLGTLAITCP